MKFKCPTCYHTVAKHHRAISCDSCSMWSHKKRQNISAKQYQNMLSQSDKNELNFICSSCYSNTLPFPEGFQSDENIITTPTDLHDIPNFSDEIRKIKGLKIGHLNINGLFGKIDFILLFRFEDNYMIVIVIKPYQRYGWSCVNVVLLLEPWSEMKSSCNFESFAGICKILL